MNLGEKLLSEVAELENMLSNSSPTKNTNVSYSKLLFLNKIHTFFTYIIFSFLTPFE